MNLYNCWYQGIPGHCYRQKKNRWLFVPEPGRADNRLHPDLELSDLVFKYKHEYLHELENSKNRQGFSFSRCLSAVFPPKQAMTVAGKLLMPSSD